MRTGLRCDMLNRFAWSVSFVALMMFAGSGQAGAQSRAYVANFFSNNVSLIDTSSNTVVATVAVGDQPQGLAVTPDGTRVYQANCGGDVFVLDTSTNKVSTKIVVGGCPTGVAFTPDGMRAYVTKDNANAVAVIDTTSTKVVLTVAVGPAPGGVAITPDGKRAYVTNASGTVSVIDTSSNTVTATVTLGNTGPVGVVITPDGTRAYVKNGLASVSVIDTSSNTVAATVSLTGGNDSSPVGLAITPDGKRVYVTRFAINSVAVIDTSSNSVVATVPVTGFPAGVAITPDGTRVYVSSSPDATGFGDGTASVIDTSSNTVVAKVTVGVTPFGIAIAPGSGKPAAAPVVASGGIVPGTVTSGEWVSIYGTNLAGGTAVWAGNFPTSLGGTSVTIGGKAAYLSFVSPGQVNVQVPNLTATGPVPVVVTTASGSGTSTVTSASFGPYFFVLDSKHVAGIILRSDGSGAFGGGRYDIIGPTGASLGYPTVAAKAGDAVELFGTGFGPTNPTVPPGQAFSGSAPTNNPVIVSINGMSLTPSFAGLSGPGLYQFNLTVPSGLGAGELAFQATVGGVKTPAGVVISLQ
jgi:uncharacterized protein (TIGR03437 family)